MSKSESKSTQTEQSAAGVAWDLGALYTAHDDPRIVRDLDKADVAAAAFEKKFRGKIAPGTNAKTMLDALQAYETLQNQLARIGSYGYLLYAADTTKHEHRALIQHNEERAVALRNKVMFFEIEWVDAPEARAQALIHDPLLTNYKHYLEQSRRYKPHTLSEPEERVSNEKDVTGISAWTKLFTEFTSGLQFKMEVKGQMRVMTQSEILVLMRNEDRATRQRAHDTFFAELQKQAPLLTFIYDTRFQDQLIDARIRDYSDTAAPRHLANDVDASAVNTMMLAVERNHPLAHRYWRLKARLLGLPKLELYDQYAPLPEAKERITYTDAGTRVINAVQRFSPELAHLAQQFFENSWIDADPRQGKRGGAFCAGVTPDTHPFILMNYNDDLRDVMTLAHEMGHGLHDMLAKKQTLFNYRPSLPIAETASVFAEMLVFDDLLSSMPDKRKRLALLCSKIEDSFSTCFRQTVMTRFEELAYAARAKGRLQTEQINQLWLQANAPYYGDALNMTAGYEQGWSYIPHIINTPFYCYAYSFGLLLVLALYGRYRRLKDDASKRDYVTKYCTLLAAGSSKAPRELMADVGFDLNDPAFWQIGFDELARLVDEAEALAKQI